MAELKGTFYGVSVGPGDPELLTLQAVRLLRQCPVLAAPQTASGQMLALDIARRALGSELDGKTILSAIEKVSLSDELLEKMRREHEIEEAEHEHEHHHHHDHDEHDEHDEHEHPHHHHDGEECDDPECECHHHHHHHADDVFSSWGKETPKKFSKEALEDMLHKLDSGDYGHILRAKGIVNGEDGWLEFDYVPEEHEVRAGHPDYTGRLCVIGAELKEDGLAELFGV